MRKIRFCVVPLCAVLCLVVVGCAAEERPAKRVSQASKVRPNGPQPAEPVSPAPAVNPNAVLWLTPKPPANPQAGDVWMNPKDGMEMVYIAPGEFTLGTSDAQIDAWLKEHAGEKRQVFKDQQPQCQANLPGYWTGRTEVTNAQYLQFVRATGHRAPDHWSGGEIPSGLERFPVVFVSWEDARSYCEWAGRRLPTELEWEKAARGSGSRTFPWGESWDPRRCRNLELITGETHSDPSDWAVASEEWVASHDGFREGPAAVGSYPIGASPYGCLDMAGNVEEWCVDWYDEHAYRRYAKGDFTPPLSGTYRVLRGGSWYNGTSRYFRCDFRCYSDPANRGGNLGFRCVRGLS